MNPPPRAASRAHATVLAGTRPLLARWFYPAFRCPCSRLVVFVGAIETAAERDLVPAGSVISPRASFGSSERRLAGGGVDAKCIEFWQLFVGATRGNTTGAARELQFHVNNLAPLVAVRSPPGEWNSGTLKRNARAARGHARSASTQPPGGSVTSTQLPRGASIEAPSS